MHEHVVAFIPYAHKPHGGRFSPNRPPGRSCGNGQDTPVGVPRQGQPYDRDARPSFDETLALRLEAMAMMRRVVDGLTESLAGPGRPNEGETTFPLRECLLVDLNEEWWHRKYAERDSAVLEERG
ncbi:DinB family protein [Streptomyces sp. NPDC001156]